MTVEEAFNDPKPNRCFVDGGVIWELDRIEPYKNKKFPYMVFSKSKGGAILRFSAAGWINIILDKLAFTVCGVYIDDTTYQSKILDVMADTPEVAAEYAKEKCRELDGKDLHIVAVFPGILKPVLV